MKIFKEYIALYLILALYSFCFKEDNAIEYEADAKIPSTNIDLPEFHLN